MKSLLKSPAEAVQRVERVACEECHGRGYIRQWPPGHEERAHMGRCEQCSGMGRVKA